MHIELDKSNLPDYEPETIMRAQEQDEEEVCDICKGKQRVTTKFHGKFIIIDCPKCNGGDWNDYIYSN